jgi:hypothetical protein
MGRYVGRPEKTGAEGSGDRSATQGISPQYYRNHVKMKNFFNRLKEEDPLDGNCNKFSRLNPRRKHGMTGGSWRRGRGAIAASFSSCLPTCLPILFFLHIIEKTYNLEPPISIYLKNTSMHCLYCHRTLSIHINFLMGSALLPSGSGSGLKEVGSRTC